MATIPYSDCLLVQAMREGGRSPVERGTLAPTWSSQADLKRPLRSRPMPVRHSFAGYAENQRVSGPPMQ